MICHKMETDSQIAGLISEEIQWDAIAKKVSVQEEVFESVATLRGKADSYAEKMAAGEAAHRVAGIRDVANEIEVTPQKGTLSEDTELARAVRQVLEWDALVPEDDIQSTVTDGWVILEGKVHSLREREGVEFCVRRLIGVKGIDNRIVVDPTASPGNLRDRIKKALERNAAHHIEHEVDDIQIDIKGNTVKLIGTVESSADRETILDIISHAPGIVTIQDEFEIEPEW